MTMTAERDLRATMPGLCELRVSQMGVRGAARLLADDYREASPAWRELDADKLARELVGVARGVVRDLRTMAAEEGDLGEYEVAYTLRAHARELGAELREVAGE